MARESTVKLSVYGLLNDVTFHMAKCCSEDLHEKDPVKYPEPDIHGMLEFEWDLFVESKRKELRDEMWVFDDKAMAFANDALIGSPQVFLRWAEQEHNYENFRPLPLYITLAEEAYNTHLASKKHDYVYMDVTIGGVQAGRLLIELFSDIVPKTCANFRALCTGENGESHYSEFRLHYEGSQFHRIVKNGWVQGGDIWLKKGDGGESIYGPVFEDENFAISHDRRGIVGMANKGRHTNGSQFYITLQPAKWMDTKYVAFGQVIEGTRTLAAIEKQETVNERPINPITIASSGVALFEF
jgi:peptidyl-prolyl cis-trans isomerase-like 6